MSREIVFKTPSDGKNLLVQEGSVWKMLGGGGPSAHLGVGDAGEFDPYIQLTNADLDVLIQNPDLVKQFWGPFGFTDNNIRYESGIYNEIKNKIFNEVEISDKLLQVFLIGYTQDLQIVEELLNYVIDEKSDQT